MHSLAFSPPEDKNISNRAPLLAMWPSLIEQRNVQYQVEIEKTSVKEAVRSNLSNENVIRSESGTIAFQISRDFYSDLHLGLQVHNSDFPAENLSINLNVQYDFYYFLNFKSSIGLMYGGLIHPDERFGSHLLISYQLSEAVIFVDAQYTKSERTFQLVAPSSKKPIVENHLRFDLDSTIILVGAKFHSLILDDIYFQIAIGSEIGIVNNIRDEKYLPTNYQRDNGYIMSLSFIAYPH